MEKHASKDDMVKNFENLLAKINALEVTAKDDYCLLYTSDAADE